VLESEDGKHTEVMYRFLSRNMIKGAWQATDEEKLIELVLELRDNLSLDQEAERSDPDEDDLDVLYPAFSSALQEKAKAFINEGGYRRLCSVSSFFLGLVMLSRVRRHYTHAPWFKVSILNDMLKTHGGVSVYIQCDKVCSYIYIVSCGIHVGEHRVAGEAREPAEATTDACGSGEHQDSVHGSLI
jgi:hypothetical protein